MMEAIREDRAPSYYFLHYDLATWSVRNLLLVPSFAFPPSAIIKCPPLLSTVRRAGWVGCNFDLSRVPADDRIPVVTEKTIVPATEVRGKFKRVKPLKEISVKQRGWTLDVLNIVRRLVEERSVHAASTSQLLSTLKRTEVRAPLEFTNEDVYTHARELEQLHPDNRHVRDKIRQQLQVLRDLGLLLHIGPGLWRLP